MPQIVLHKSRTKIEVPVGANLMESLVSQGVPVASSCAGDGVCGKCRLQILKGEKNLTPPNETEIFLAETNDLRANERISCQTQVLGDIEVDASYW